jgi:aminopeptidase N
VCRDYQAPIDLFDRHLYEKGALVLHMLRRAVGDDLFWQGVRLYLERHARGIVETRDLERAFEEVSGHSLERFFDEWVHRSHHPELKVRVAWEDGQLSTHVSQAQKGKDVAVFAFELEVTVCAPDGTLESHRKSVKSATDVLSLPLPERPRWVAFNPELRVLAAVTLEVPADMLERQLEEAPRACMRWQAAEALGRRHDARAVSALGRALADSSAPWMVRAEAAGALGRIRGSDALRFLVEQAATSHPKVRRAVAGALGAFRSGEAFDALVALLQSDPSYLVRSEAARSIGATRQPGAIDALVPHVDEPSWADCVRAGVLAGIAASRDDRGLSVVVERTRYGFENPGRRAAIGALAKLSDDRRARERLEELLDDPDPHVRIAVIAALESLGRRESMAALRQCLEREGDGRVRRRAREALKALGTSASGTSQRLQDDLESVRGELAELKTRLSKLESRGAEPAPPDARAAKKSEKTSGKQRKAKRPARKVTSRRRR